MKSKRKSEIRKKILDVRNHMNEKKAKDLSYKIMLTLIKLSVFQKNQNIMLYLSFNNEVDSYRLIKYAKSRNKRVMVPLVRKRVFKLIPTEVKDIDKELTKSSFGYMKPKKEFERLVEPKELDLIVIPGIAFDKKCYRIGFGAGYYDRFLASINNDIPTVGLAYDYQIIDSVPVELHDIPLDYIITEKRIIVR